MVCRKAFNRKGREGKPQRAQRKANPICNAKTSAKAQSAWDWWMKKEEFAGSAVICGDDAVWD
jgi:hypothetical protein